MEVLAQIETVFELIVNFGILLMEAIGVIILLWSGIRGAVFLVLRRPHVRLELAQGISLALEFKMGSEVLRTVIVREFREIAMLGAIIVLRAALSFLLSWEIREEEKRIDTRYNVPEDKPTPHNPKLN